MTNEEKKELILLLVMEKNLDNTTKDLRQVLANFGRIPTTSSEIASIISDCYMSAFKLGIGATYDFITNRGATPPPVATDPGASENQAPTKEN